MQKPPRGVGKKQFSGGFLAAPAAVVKKPAVLKTRPAWKQLDRLGWWWLVWPSHLGLVVCRRVGAVEVACLLTQIKGLDQRINNLGIKRDRQTVPGHNVKIHYALRPNILFNCITNIVCIHCIMYNCIYILIYPRSCMSNTGSTLCGNEFTPGTKRRLTHLELHLTHTL